MTRPKKPAQASKPQATGLLGLLTAPEECEPRTMLDHALLWASRKVKVFPCQRFLGTPLVPSWYKEATDSADKIVLYWAETPNADIGAVPDKSGGHSVLLATAEEDGIASLAALEAEHGPLPTTWRYFNRWGDEYLWFAEKVNTNHHQLGRGIHVLGPGHFVHLPPSWAPAIHYGDEHA